MSGDSCGGTSPLVCKTVGAAALGTPSSREAEVIAPTLW